MTTQLPEDAESLSVLKSQSRPTTLDCCDGGNDDVSSELLRKNAGSLKNEDELRGFDPVSPLDALFKLLIAALICAALSCVNVWLDSLFSSTCVRGSTLREFFNLDEE